MYDANHILDKEFVRFRAVCYVCIVIFNDEGRGV
jgi:hypothetical protein